MKKLTREWVRKAEADYRLAVTVHRGAEPFHDAVCFHCQQSAEKYLKGLIEELGLTVPKTHDLERLRGLLTAHAAALRPLKRGMAFLTRFAVETRYPGDDASKRQAEAALRWAARVRTAARTLLGMRPGRMK
jgi:HEPN domain-containing protein